MIADDQERHEDHADADVAPRRLGLRADGEADEHQREQRGELALGFTMRLEPTTMAATASGARRRQARLAIASPATTTCSTGELTLALNSASAAVIATKTAAITRVEEWWFPVHGNDRRSSGTPDTSVERLICGSVVPVLVGRGLDLGDVGLPVLLVADLVVVAPATAVDRLAQDVGVARRGGRSRRACGPATWPSVVSGAPRATTDTCAGASRPSSRIVLSPRAHDRR